MLLKSQNEQDKALMAVPFQKMAGAIAARKSKQSIKKY